MKKKKIFLVFIFIALAGPVVFFGVKGIRMAVIGADFRSQIRYLTENGETVGEKPALEALSTDYLQTIFGENKELLSKLQGLVQKGLSDTPSLSLGEVAAMMVTYRLSDDREVKDVCAYVIGDFPTGRRKLGFHRDGYLDQHLDNRLWAVGNTAVSFIGRDMILFAEENVLETQQRVIESVFSGDIMYLADLVQEPLYFSLVLPEPRRVVPSLLRSHIQAVVVKGNLSPEKGRFESIILTPSSKSAGYVLTNINDLKSMAEITMRTKWKGVEVENQWGHRMIETWWAHELANNLEKATLERQYNIVRIRMNFERPMVNVVLKGIERMGRDIAQMRATLDNKLDPRLVQARMRNKRIDGYWSKDHISGPDWPIPAPDRREMEEAAKEAAEL